MHDRGYLDHELYRDILDAGSSFIGRMQGQRLAYTVAEVRPLSAEARRGRAWSVTNLCDDWEHRITKMF